MPYVEDYDSYDHSEDDDAEDLDWSDDSDDDAETRECPSCGADVYEDAFHCPICGEHITWSTSAWTGRPLWWIGLGLAGMAAVVFVLTLVCAS